MTQTRRAGRTEPDTARAAGGPGAAHATGAVGATDAADGRRGALNAFARFVLCGGGVSLLSSGVLLAVGGRVPFAVANAVVTVVSTLLATELHQRFTFGEAGAGPGGRLGRRGWAGWRVHAKSALTLAAAYLVTTAAVLVLDAVRPHPGPLLAQAVYLTAAGLAGIGRFLVLRLVIFARKADPDRPAADGRTLRRGEVTVAA